MGMFSLFHILILAVIVLVPVGAAIAVLLTVFVAKRPPDSDRCEAAPREEEVRSNVMNCPACGKVISRSAASCTNCGISFEGGA
jgi:hypothetical protein